MTICRDQERVLDANSPAAGKVDPWLNGDRCFGRKPTFGTRTDHRGLVDLQADAVPESVAEALAVPGRFDHPAARRVQICERNAWPCRGSTGLGSGSDQCMEFNLQEEGSPTMNVRVMSA